jgi:TfoX/Sxy family transcriptional regulator of competence genes
MAADEKTLNRVRMALAHLVHVEEKQMFKGITFMVNGKMCVGVREGEIMCRIDPEKAGEVLEREGCTPMIHNGRVMKGFVFVDESGYRRKSDFEYFVGLAIEFNKKAKASKKKKTSSPTKASRNSR